LTDLPQQLTNGILLSSNYMLVAIGLTLIFGILLVPNFAHGDLFMAGAFLTYTLVHSSLPFLAAIVLAVAAMAIAGILVDLVVFKPLADRPGLTMMIAALGLSVILQNGATLLYGSEAHAINTPIVGVVVTKHVIVTYYQLTMIAVTIVSVALVFVMLRYTKIGLGLRAMAQNRDAAALVGIGYGQVRAVTFGVGTGLATLAGGLLAGTQPLSPTMGVQPILKAFVIIVIGGIGSLSGAVLASILLGMSEVLVAAYISSLYRDVVAVALLVLVLVARPQGLFASRSVRD
jgi:branched-chain amino acid transport system permease protein